MDDCNETSSIKELSDTIGVTLDTINKSIEKSCSGMKQTLSNFASFFSTSLTNDLETKKENQKENVTSYYLEPPKINDTELEYSKESREEFKKLLIDIKQGQDNIMQAVKENVSKPKTAAYIQALIENGLINDCMVVLTSLQKVADFIAYEPYNITPTKDILKQFKKTSTDFYSDTTIRDVVHSFSKK